MDGAGQVVGGPAGQEQGWQLGAGPKSCARVGGGAKVLSVRLGVGPENAGGGVRKFSLSGGGFCSLAGKLGADPEADVKAWAVRTVAGAQGACLGCWRGMLGGGARKFSLRQ
jgi:hypothetical protein